MLLVFNDPIRSPTGALRRLLRLESPTRIGLVIVHPTSRAAFLRRSNPSFKTGLKGHSKYIGAAQRLWKYVDVWLPTVLAFGYVSLPTVPAFGTDLDLFTCVKEVGLCGVPRMAVHLFLNCVVVKGIAFFGAINGRQFLGYYIR